jgi:hypothetical protein
MMMTDDLFSRVKLGLSVAIHEEHGFIYYYFLLEDGDIMSYVNLIRSSALFCLLERH